MYPAVSALVSGALLYCLGTGSKKAELKTEVEQPQLQAKSFADNVKPLTQNSSSTTFTPDSITNILRTFYIHERCYLIYSTLHKAPLAVHELLDKNVIDGDAKRKRDFQQDKNIVPEKFAVNANHYRLTSAYRTHRFHRGHMAAAGNYSSDKVLKDNTFSYANTIPQNQDNNQGIWNTFERYSRDLLYKGKCQTIELVSGPIYYSQKHELDSAGKPYENVYKNEEKVLLKDGIIVPPRLYKIIKCNTKEGSYTSGFTFANDSSIENQKHLKDYEEALEEIQNQTGLEFKFKGGPRLTEYDKEGTSQTKYYYDYLFYDGLVKKSKTIYDVNSGVNRARGQKIYLKTQDYSELIDNLYKVDLEHIKTYETYTTCQRLNKLLALHKDLYYLYSLKPYNQELSREIEQRIVPCHEQDDKANKGRIQKKADSEGRYTYPHQDLLRQYFGERKEYSQ